MKIHINVEECKRDSPQFRWEETKIMKYMYLEMKLLCYSSFKHPWWSFDTQKKWWFFCYYYQEHDGLLLSRHTSNSDLSTGRLPDLYGVSWFWFSIFYPWISSLCCKWIFQSQHFAGYLYTGGLNQFKQTIFGNFYSGATPISRYLEHREISRFSTRTSCHVAYVSRSINTSYY